MVDDVDKQIAAVDGTITQAEASKPDYNPVYTVYENSRIPVSKAMGKIWKMRWEEARKHIEHYGFKDRWDEAIRYYQNDQGGRAGKRHRLEEVGTGDSHEFKYGSENIVFANVSALVPAVYAKNPDVEITSVKAEGEQGAELYERLLDTLFKRKIAPGISLKDKMRKLVLTTMLTNVSYLELSYVRKEDGSEAAVEEIEKLSKELSEAKKPEDIRTIEGKLQALEHKIALLSPSGPKSKFRLPHMVLRDPASDSADLCDDDYVFVGEYIRTDFLRAVYGKKDANGEWMSIYKPTHVLSGDKNSLGHDDEINNFTLLTEGAEHERYGYANKDDFEHACRTLCWYVWDKTTRRVFLFNESDWTWPVWVWDDPYNLSRFYPIFPLTFYTDPKDPYARSEIMYYLDQQDEINEINNERARMRHWVLSKIFVNTNTVRDSTQIEAFLRGNTRKMVHGLDIPEGKSISDVLGAFPAPSTQYETLFDTRPVIESINRVSSVTPILQNVQFKTNTTNRAIESYESSTQMRLDEKIDAVEDMLGDFGRALLEMCVQFMTAQEVEDLLGSDFVQSKGGWLEAQDVGAFNRDYSFDIVGGSTLKPTAKVKKEQAMQMGQILGQFANASPMLIIVMLKMLQRAFSDDVIITPEEWEVIVQGTQQQMQRGSPDQGGGSPEGAGQPAEAPQEGQPAEGGDINAIMTQVEQIIDRLPPEAKQFLGEGIAQGVPLKELVLEIMSAAEQNAGTNAAEQ